MTRVGLHDYVTDPLLPQKDGANLAHENIAELLKICSAPHLEAQFHDFMRLLKDEEYARQTLGGLDCVVSNVGPHAHYYFWLRERLGLDFRIIRDVRTAIWSSYLLQEYLCQPLLRQDDTLLVASNYTRDIYRQMFPHLSNYPDAICYPLTVCFPEPRPETGERKQRTSGTPITLGYLGRLSEDKNFPDIVELLIHLNCISDNRYNLMACGEVHSPNCAPDLVRARLHDALGHHDCFTYHPPCRNDEIWSFLTDVDILLFPSTSNLETLGRVLVEASYARIPVISGDHAAAAELVTPSGLCPVRYDTSRRFSAHQDHNMGNVAVTDMAAAIMSDSLRASECYDRYKEHPADFIKLLVDVPQTFRENNIDKRVPLLDMLVVDLPAPLEHQQSMQQISECALWFTALQSKRSNEHAQRSLDLLKLSRYPERTQRYLAKSSITAGDFTNIGGIDIELCHLLAFYPEFRIAADLHDGRCQSVANCSPFGKVGPGPS